MKLVYVGKATPIGSALALPEGWEAADHTEKDAKRADAKLKSGLYIKEAAKAEVKEKSDVG